LADRWDILTELFLLSVFRLVPTEVHCVGADRELAHVLGHREPTVSMDLRGEESTQNNYCTSNCQFQEYERLHERVLFFAMVKRMLRY
jgi:hypothetical protein